MGRKVKCEVCGKEKVVYNRKQNYFVCCNTRQKINDFPEMVAKSNFSSETNKKVSDETVEEVKLEILKQPEKKEILEEQEKKEFKYKCGKCNFKFDEPLKSIDFNLKKYYCPNCKVELELKENE